MIGIWASTGIGIFDATVGCLIAKKLDPYIGNIDFEWELSPSLVVYMGLVGAFFRLDWDLDFLIVIIRLRAKNYES